MAVKAWIHKETGLPCFYLDGPDAALSVSDGPRVILPAEAGRDALSVCDPLAPPGVATTYTVGTRRFTLTRRGEGYAITSLDSRARATVSFIGDDAREYDTRATATDINARRTPVIRWAGVAAAYTGKLELLAYAEESARLERILEAREPVIAVHSHDACDLADCDIPAVRVLAITHATSQRTGRRDRVRRQWTLDYKQIDLDEARALVGTIPVVTWGAWDAVSKWRGRSYVDLLREFAGMP
jgi:hypothetical protein